MKEKRTHLRKSICLVLVFVLAMAFSTTVSAKKIYLDDIAYEDNPVFVKAGDKIYKGDADLEGSGMRVRYELSESSGENFPGTSVFYKENPHEVREYELNGVTYNLWRVKYATTDREIYNVILVPGGGSTNYVGYFSDRTYDSEEPCVITIKNTKEPENCFANFENGNRKYKVIIDEGEDREQRLEYDKDYDYYQGSTVIEINRGIIQDLRKGNHTVTVHFADGMCTVKFVKGDDEAHAAGSQPSNASVQTVQQNTASNVSNGKKQAPKTGEV